VISMTMLWLAVDNDGNITAGSTTPPELIPMFPGDKIPTYNYSFDVSRELINDIWRYKVVDGELIAK
jgi:hypothetical protein